MSSPLLSTCGAVCVGVVVFERGATMLRSAVAGKKETFFCFVLKKMVDFNLGLLLWALPTLNQESRSRNQRAMARRATSAATAATTDVDALEQSTSHSIAPTS